VRQDRERERKRERGRERDKGGGGDLIIKGSDDVGKEQLVISNLKLLKLSDP
jgi:hypothetical protein